MLDLIRQRASSWGVKIAFAIIILVFVFWGVGGYNNTGPGTVATVNGKAILMQDFQRDLRAEEERFRAMAPDLSPEDLRQFQLPQQVLSRLVTRELIDQEAKRLGVVVTPREYAAFLRGQPTFQKDGKFDPQVYEQFVANQRMNIADFEQNLMRDLLMDKMQSYVASAVSVTPEEARLRIGFQMERRVMSYVLFATEDYNKDIAVTDDAVKAYYGDNQAQFTRPAAIAVSYLDVTPAALAHTMEVTDEDVEKLYAVGPLRYNTRQVHLRVPEGADEAAVKAMEEKLETVATELRAGKNFAEATKVIAEEYPDADMGESGMMEARRMPEELLGALAGLQKGEVGPIVRPDNVLVLVQLIETDPDWSLPEAEIKDAFRRELGERKAALAFRDIQAEAEDAVAMGKSFADIAKELKIEPRTTALAPRDELLHALELRNPAQLSLLDGAKGALVGTVLETREGFVVAEIADTRPAGVQPLEEVSGLIRDILTRREAEKKAEEAARAAVAEFANDVPDAYKEKLVTSEPFNRMANIPALGYAKSLTDAVFSSPLDKWLPEPFATPKGAVIAMPVEILPLSDEEWEKNKTRSMEFILQSKRGQLMNSFLGELHKKAEVRVTDTAIFEQ